jgi:hypothetical protein
MVSQAYLVKLDLMDSQETEVLLEIMAHLALLDSQVQMVSQDQLVNQAPLARLVNQVLLVALEVGVNLDFQELKVH